MTVVLTAEEESMSEFDLVLDLLLVLLFGLLVDVPFLNLLFEPLEVVIIEFCELFEFLRGGPTPEKKLLGSSTELMIWTTPFVTPTSAVVTLALLIVAVSLLR